jgi:hypothetical protein
MHATSGMMLKPYAEAHRENAEKRTPLSSTPTRQPSHPIWRTQGNAAALGVHVQVQPVFPQRTETEERQARREWVVVRIDDYSFLHLEQVGRSLAKHIAYFCLISVQPESGSVKGKQPSAMPRVPDPKQAPRFNASPMPQV